MIATETSIHQSLKIIKQFKATVRPLTMRKKKQYCIVDYIQKSNGLIIIYNNTINERKTNMIDMNDNH